MVYRKCGLIARVSTLGQARVEEGSTTLQIDMMRAHIAYQNQIRADRGAVREEEWTEAKTYILEGISGSKSVQSDEFQQLYQDIETGAVNTVLCTRLDRVSRSIRDFIEFFDYLDKRGVGFVCVTQQIDTTSSYGRFISYILMALAELEREQTSERMQISKVNRAGKGIWTGGVPPLGYDLADKQGELVVNKDEAVIVQHIFTEYLKLGSLRKVIELLNREGHRTKRRISKQGVVRGGKKFTLENVRRILRNKAYVGILQVNKKYQHVDQDSLKETQLYSEVKATWEAIVPEQLFDKVQTVLDEGNATRHNVVARRKHNYLLSGLMYCGKCLKPMKTDSTTKPGEVRYFRYVCKTPECTGSVPASEIEETVIKSVSELAFKPDRLSRIIEETNNQITADLPRMRKELQVHQKTLKRTNDKIKTLMENLGSLDENAQNEVKAELERQSQRKRENTDNILHLEARISGCGNDKVVTEAVVIALDNFARTIGRLDGREQKALMKSVVNRVYWDGNNGLRVGVHGSQPHTRSSSLTAGNEFAGRHAWRLDEDSNLGPSG